MTSPISSLPPNLNGPGVVIPTTPQMMNPQPLEPPPFFQAQQPYFPPIGTFQPHPVLATVQQASQPVMQVPIVVQPMPIQRSPFPSQPPIAPVMTPPQGMFPPLPPPLSQQLQQIPQQIQHSTFQHPPPKTQQSVPPNHQSAHSQIHLQTHPQAHTHTHSLPPQIPVSQTIPVKPKEEPMQFVIPPIPSLSDPHPLIPPISIVSSIQPNIHPNLQTGVTQPKTPQIEPQTHHHVPATSPAMYAIQSPNGILLNPPKEYHVGPKEVGDVQNQAIHVSIKAPTFDGRLYSVY
ncbi:hypothetical protein TRFO_38681 [Tritrichomonas foetus]|uniref:Uncharacterized protein n=1 Tax=Tritrichomonas foetus TaxID=1144522 RepID=A0A1J4JBS6_9EUKA|nr:hypothetical protein TRFO_38681 [Tritrichomonas foetus]|eukprot:OHS95107.1 hypothetical protein TRFO_38681 [Tritrichomonas foetus]